jgi:hypothetical protein
MIRAVVKATMIEDWTYLRDSRGVIQSMTMDPRFQLELECGHVVYRNSNKRLVRCTECKETTK